MRFAIKGGRILCDGMLQKKDILVSGDRIIGIGSGLCASHEIDASGLIVLPGFIDCHVHFREPGDSYKEDWSSGSRSAVAGGVTTVLDMPNNQVHITSRAALEEKKGIASAKSLCNFGLFMEVNSGNIDEINSSGQRFVKLFYGKTTGGSAAGDTESIFKNLSKDILIAVHAEDNDIIEENRKNADLNDPACHSFIRDSRAEYAAIGRLVGLAEKYSRRLHICHVSSGKSLQLIADAKTRGIEITCETCPHYLLLDESAYSRIGNRAKVNPALKKTEDRKGLWQGLKDGTIDMISSDHAPHLLEEKEGDYNHALAGFPGVETMLVLLLAEAERFGLGIEDLSRLMSENPAEIFSLAGKGKLEEGYDADIMILDKGTPGIVDQKKLHSKAGWSPFDGYPSRGRILYTLVGGNLIFDKGIFHDHIGGYVK